MKTKLLTICLILVPLISWGGEIDGKMLICEFSKPVVSSHSRMIGFKFINGRVKSEYVNKRAEIKEHKESRYRKEYSTTNHHIYWWTIYSLDRKTLSIFKSSTVGVKGVCEIMNSKLEYISRLEQIQLKTKEYNQKESKDNKI